MQLSRRARIAGGTGFWGPEQEAPRYTQYGEPSTAPSVVMRPAPGSALLYGGSITHAGMPVMMGCRVIFLASFSSRRLDLRAAREQLKPLNVVSYVCARSCHWCDSARV